MTDLELRRFAEIGGWKHAKNCNVVLDGSGVYTFRHHPDCVSFAPDGMLTGTPDFLAPENLHLCFDVLERVCKKRTALYTISSGQKDSDECGVIGEHFNMFLVFVGSEDCADACAATKNEAIINAVLAASQERK
jgi:hypothetical protein